MSRRRDALVNSGDDVCSGIPHEHFHVPSIEEQLKALQPTQDLLDFYRKKLAYYEKEFGRMTERVNMCKRACETENTIETELMRCNYEVHKLQKALSDMQVYLHQERNQVLMLHAENDRLRIQIAKDRKTINFLLPLCGATEQQVYYLMKSSNAESLSQTRPNKSKGKSQLTKSTENGTETDVEILSLKLSSLDAHLKEFRKASQDEMHSLHQDRELILMEKEKEHKKMQNQIKMVTDRLTESQINVCELTTELITLKREFAKKEEKWELEKEMLLQKKFPHKGYGSSRESEHYDIREKVSKESLMNLFKDQLHQKEKLIRMYKDQCASLEAQLWELNNSKEKSSELLLGQMEKLYKQLFDIKGRYDQLYRKRSLEAEGFQNDVKILKGRIRSLERKLTFSTLTASVPKRKEQIEYAKWLKNISKFLEKELSNIESKVSAS